MGCGKIISLVAMLIAAFYLQGCGCKAGFVNLANPVDVSEDPTDADQLEATAGSLAITSPSTTGAHTIGTATVAISGTCSTNVTSLSVSGTAASATLTDQDCADGTWAIAAATLNSGANTITLSAVDSRGVTLSTTLVITYIPPPSSLSYNQMTIVYTYNDQNGTLTPNITNNNPTVTGTVTEYSINPDLKSNTGLDFGTMSGVISGTPTATSAAQDYVITATNGGGSTTATVNIRTAPGFLVNSTSDANDTSTADNECDSSGIGAGTCTLRAAAVQLNAWSNAVNRVIVIPDGTITLGGTEIPLNRQIEVIGTSQSGTIVSGNDTSRVFNMGTQRTIKFSKLTIRNGVANGDSGGCLDGTGTTLTLDQVTLRNCSADEGGAISNWSNFSNYTVDITITRSSFIDNTASVAGGAVIKARSSIAGNELTISDSIFQGNGGDSIIETGGSYPEFTGLVERSLFTGNLNGPVFDIEPSDFTIKSSTIANNNSGSTSSGGITTNNDTRLTLINNTIANNTCAGCFGAAGFSMNTGGFAYLTNNIVFNNTSSGSAANCGGAGTITSNGYNLSGPHPGGGGGNNCWTSTTGDLVDVDPLLGALQDNGGPTFTYAITSSSPAYNAGSNASCPALDQRGLPRPAAVTCDIGAFEAQ